MKEKKKSGKTTVKKKRRISRFHMAIILFAAILAVSAGLTALLIVQAHQGRNPDAAGKVRSVLVLGVALAETTGIYALVISILLIFLKG